MNFMLGQAYVIKTFGVIILLFLLVGCQPRMESTAGNWMTQSDQSWNHIIIDNNEKEITLINGEGSDKITHAKLEKVGNGFVVLDADNRMISKMEWTGNKQIQIGGILYYRSDRTRR